VIVVVVPLAEIGPSSPPYGDTGSADKLFVDVNHVVLLRVRPRYKLNAAAGVPGVTVGTPISSNTNVMENGSLYASFVNTNGNELAAEYAEPPAPEVMALGGNVPEVDEFGAEEGGVKAVEFVDCAYTPEVVAFAILTVSQLYILKPGRPVGPIMPVAPVLPVKPVGPKTGVNVATPILEFAVVNVLGRYRARASGEIFAADEILLVQKTSPSNI
jgi:hypothetical protein